MGQNARKYPDLIKTTYTAGNEIGNHTESHPYIFFKSRLAITRQIEITDQLIQNAGYSGAIHFRAPYGLKLLALTRVLHRLKRQHVFWTFSLFDWRCPSPEKMFRRFRRHIKPGAIVLLHDGFTVAPTNRDNTVKLVEMVLEKYSAEGYRFVTLSELLAIGK